jgi:hypothetical protein
MIIPVFYVHLTLSLRLAAIAFHCNSSVYTYLIAAIISKLSKMLLGIGTCNAGANLCQCESCDMGSKVKMVIMVGLKEK